MSEREAEHATANRAGPGVVERRAFRRAPLDRPVMLETASGSTTARTVDVSGGGMSLLTDLAVEIGQRLSVYFELPIGFGVETDAIVLRREGSKVTVQFVDGPREAMLAVRSFCRVSGLMPAYRTNGAR